MQSDALFRKCLPIGLLLLAACHAAAQERSAYNIVLIMADDAGVETIGTYGGNSHATPEINRLAAEGMRFDYVGSRYVFDRNWKLYSDGRFYDIQWDPEETHAISTSGGLRPTARQAFERLRAIIRQHPNSPNWGEQFVDAPD